MGDFSALFWGLEKISGVETGPGSMCMHFQSEQELVVRVFAMY
jgi:hypothetical protein